MTGLQPSALPTGDLRQRLQACLSGATRANEGLAHYFLAHFDDLPFETAATLAVKAAIRSDPGERAWPMGDRLAAVATRLRAGVGSSGGMQREIAAIMANYETAATPDFARAMARIARSPLVYVAGFQTERGHGQYLAHGLQYLRPGVHLLDQSAGNFAEVLLAPEGQACLILIDGRRYSRLTRDLAVAARDAAIPVTLITDPYCPWAKDLADEVFVVPTDFEQFWDATSAMASLIGLIVNGVFAELGSGVEARMARVSSLYDRFIGHSGDPGRVGRS